MRIVYNGEERGACPGTLASSCFVTYRPSSSKTYTVTAPTWSLNMSARCRRSSWRTPPSGRTTPQTIFSSYPSYILVFRSTFFPSFFFLFIYSGLCRTCGSTSWFPLPLGKSLPFLCSRPTGSGTGGTSRLPPCGGSAPQGRTSFPIPKKGRPESPETARPPPISLYSFIFCKTLL